MTAKGTSATVADLEIEDIDLDSELLIYYQITGDMNAEKFTVSRSNAKSGCQKGENQHAQIRRKRNLTGGSRRGYAV